MLKISSKWIFFNFLGNTKLDIRYNIAQEIRTKMSPPQTPVDYTTNNLLQIFSKFLVKYFLANFSSSLFAGNSKNVDNLYKKLKTPYLLSFNIVCAIAIHVNTSSFVSRTWEKSHGDYHKIALNILL